MTHSQDIALITGASSGLGAELARVLAQRKIDLILSSRRADCLSQLGNRLGNEFGVRVHVIPQDLNRPTGAEELFEKVKRRNLSVSMLINNAGVGKYGITLYHEPEAIKRVIQINAVATTVLTRMFAEEMVWRGRGFILNNASFSAVMPIPRYSVYSGAKALVVAFSQALRYELRHSGVKVSTVCPGWMPTEFFNAAGQSPSRWMRLLSLSPEYVARVAVDGMLRGKAFIVPGLFYRLLYLASRFLPRASVSSLAARTVRPESAAGQIEHAESRRSTAA